MPTALDGETSTDFVLPEIEAQTALVPRRGGGTDPGQLKHVMEHDGVSLELAALKPPNAAPLAPRGSTEDGGDVALEGLSPEIRSAYRSRRGRVELEDSGRHRSRRHHGSRKHHSSSRRKKKMKRRTQIMVACATILLAWIVLDRPSGKRAPSSDTEIPFAGNTTSNAAATSGAEQPPSGTTTAPESQPSQGDAQTRSPASDFTHRRSRAKHARIHRYGVNNGK
jgi:hypothetical protein